MSDRTKAKVAFAEAITQALWITAKERDQIAKKTGNKLRKRNC